MNLLVSDINPMAHENHIPSHPMGIDRWELAPGSLVWVRHALPAWSLTHVADDAVIVTTPEASDTQLFNMVVAPNSEVVVIPGGDAGKTWTSVEQIHAALRESSRSRVVAVGGGACSDVAGFAAGTWRRGIPWHAIPTTLLAGVDAAIGGRTCINTNVGKNAASLFHAPNSVWVDIPELLAMPFSVLSEGAAEVIKSGFSHDTTIKAQLLEGGRSDLAEAVRRTIMVSMQESRAMLTGVSTFDTLGFGHEATYVLEPYFEYSLSHGRAVAYGLALSTALASEDALPDLCFLLRMFRLAGDTQFEMPTAAYMVAALRKDPHCGPDLMFTTLKSSDPRGLPTLVRRGWSATQVMNAWNRACAALSE